MMRERSESALEKGECSAVEFTITYKPKVKTKYLSGICSEHVRIEATDNDERLLYSRLSRIEMAGQNIPHHEVGYTGVQDISFLLSRGSYVRLEWNTEEQLFRQVDSTADTRNMTRKISFVSGHEMIWDSTMEVFSPQHSAWARHTIVTKFSLVGVGM